MSSHCGITPSEAMVHFTCTLKVLKHAKKKFLWYSCFGVSVQLGQVMESTLVPYALQTVVVEECFMLCNWMRLTQLS